MLLQNMKRLWITDSFNVKEIFGEYQFWAFNMALIPLDLAVRFISDARVAGAQIKASGIGKEELMKLGLMSYDEEEKVEMAPLDALLIPHEGEYIFITATAVGRRRMVGEPDDGKVIKIK